MRGVVRVCVCDLLRSVVSLYFVDVCISLCFRSFVVSFVVLFVVAVVCMSLVCVSYWISYVGVIA